MRSPRKLPSLPDMSSNGLQLAKIVASASYLPHPDVVKAVQNPVFPTIRDRENRLKPGIADGQHVLLDDNTTPRWALLWSHGISHAGHPGNWTFAHVWPHSKDREAYTHIANLIMMPEYFGSLSDKVGPLADYFKYHAWTRYQWKPKNAPIPIEPPGFSEVEWKYFDYYDKSNELIHAQLTGLRNARVDVIRQILGL